MGGRYSDGGYYVFDGIQIGECDLFDLGEINENNICKKKNFEPKYDLLCPIKNPTFFTCAGVGLYHSGTDGLVVSSIAFDYYEGNDFHNAACEFDSVILDLSLIHI